jgi:hypothetical protein
MKDGLTSFHDLPDNVRIADVPGKHAKALTLRMFGFLQPAPRTEGIIIKKSPDLKIFREKRLD